jgi:hypothetical protein
MMQHLDLLIFNTPNQFLLAMRLLSTLMHLLEILIESKIGLNEHLSVHLALAPYRVLL